MKIEDTLMTPNGEHWNTEFLSVLESLAIQVNKDMNSLDEGIADFIPDGSDVVAIKDLVKNTFSFIIKGNVFVYVGERNLTKPAVRKLMDFYITMQDLAERVNYESVLALTSLLSSYILYAIALGGVAVGLPASTVSEWIRLWFEENFDGEAVELDPFVYFLVADLSNNPAAQAVASTYGSAFSAGTAAYNNARAAFSPNMVEENWTTAFNMAKAYLAGKAVDHVKDRVSDHIDNRVNGGNPEAEDINLQVEMRDQVSREMVKAFLRLAKQNPRKAARFLQDIYEAAPDEYRAAFWEALKTGVRKSLIRKARQFIMNLKNYILR